MPSAKCEFAAILTVPLTCILSLSRFVCMPAQFSVSGFVGKLHTIIGQQV